MTMFHRTASTSTRALVLALATGLCLPTTALAAPTAPPAEDGGPAPDDMAEDGGPAPDDMAEDAEPAEPTDVAQPEPEPEPEPASEPKPAPAPVITPETAPPAPIDGYDPTKARRLRRGGAFTMIGGGAVVLTGLAITIAGTAMGNKNERDRRSIEDAYANEDCGLTDSGTCDTIQADLDANLEDIRSANQLARIGGVLFVAGAAAAIVGGVVYRRGVVMDERAQQARIRIGPALGGAVISGRF